MKRAGFSLIELIVVVAIMGTLLGISTIYFTQWNRKAQIESKTREIYDALNEARLNSIYIKKQHRITFQPNSYSLKRYESGDDATGTDVYSRNTTYLLSLSGGASIADIFFEFDTRGTTSNLNTIYLNPVASGAVFDCIVIHVARTNMGQGMDTNHDGKPDSCTIK